MGQQASTLNCKGYELNEKKQLTQNMEIFTKQYKDNKTILQTEPIQSTHQSQNVIPINPPPSQHTRITTQQKTSLKSPLQAVKSSIPIPEHQSLTKISESPFRSSIKDKKFYLQQKGKSLAEIVEPRYNTTKHFPYSQVLGLTQSLVYGLAYMAKKSCNHHDFYPTNIYYLEGKFKIINPLEIQVSGFHLTTQRQRFSFLSPELILAIIEQSSETEIGEQRMNKADVFAVGMILLQVCCLQPSSECYDQESYNIVDSVIRERLAKVSKIYTPVMADSINLMLQYEIQRRLDPIILAQMIHSKVEGQKIVAMQMETPKSINQQLSPGNNGNRVMPPQGMPPNILPPQQMRGPSPPYMHQPFKMQNLNQNVIAVSMPNQQFTRIGPNNQGFLSSSSLQQKLRVIQLIKEHPKQQDDDSRIQQSQMDRTNSQSGFRIENKVLIEKEQLKPQYPLVESVYNQKPLVQKFSQHEYNGRSNVVQPLVIGENRKLVSLPQMREPNRFNLSNQPYEFNRPSLSKETRNPPSLFDQKVPESYLKRDQIKTISDLQSQQQFTQLPLCYQPLPRKKPQQNQNFIPSYNYGATQTRNQIRNSPTINNIYSMNQANLPMNGQHRVTSFSNDVGSGYTKKYGTSFQAENKTETIDQRVQRVLNMSKNAK